MVAKEISDDRLEELAKYVRDEIIPCRLSEVRNMVLEVLKILGIEIKLK